MEGGVARERRLGAPLAAIEHAPLGLVLDHAAVRAADEERLLRLPLWPAHEVAALALVEAEEVHVAAVRARHEEASAVTGLKQLGDPRCTRDERRATRDDLRSEEHTSELQS